MLVSTVGPTLRGPEDLLDWLHRREPLLTGEGVKPRPEDIGCWRIWAEQARDDLPILDALLVDGDDWETLSVFDDVLG